MRPVAIDPAWVRGGLRCEVTPRGGLVPRRLTEASWRTIADPFLRASAGQLPGVRLAIRTAATQLRLTASVMRMAETADAVLPPAVVEATDASGAVVARAFADEGPRMLFSFATPVTGIAAGPDVELDLEVGGDGSERDLVVWMPYDAEVELVALAADAPVVASPVAGPTWLHHGSSISHGYVASSTTATWPVRAATAVGVELTSLALSGNAVLDQLTARSIRDASADAISVKLGINVVNGDLMRARIFASAVHGFLDTIRDGHPETPLLVVSPVICPPVEHVPGPTMQDPAREAKWTIAGGRAEDLATGHLSLGVVREILADVVRTRRAWDAQLTYLDGLALYGADDARMPMPDNLHPADDVQALMATRFAAAAFGPAGPFASLAARRS